MHGLFSPGDFLLYGLFKAGIVPSGLPVLLFECPDEVVKVVGFHFLYFLASYCSFSGMGSGMEGIRFCVFPFRSSVAASRLFFRGRSLLRFLRAAASAFIVLFESFADALAGPVKVAFDLLRIQAGNERGLFGREPFYFFEEEYAFLFRAQALAYFFENPPRLSGNPLLFGRFALSLVALAGAEARLPGCLRPGTAWDPEEGEGFHPFCTSELVYAQVVGYPVNPCGKTETGIEFPGFEPDFDKDILGNVFGIFGIPCHAQRYPEDGLAVLPRQQVERLVVFADDGFHPFFFGVRPGV